MLKNFIRFLLYIYAVFCCLIFVAGFMYCFAQSLYGNFTVRQLVFHFAFLSTMDISVKLILFVLIPPLLCAFFILFAIKKPLLWLRHYVSADISDKLRKHDFLLSFITSTAAFILIIGVIYAYSYPPLQILRQLKYSWEILAASKHYDTVIDENYTDPRLLQYTSKHKNNLIVIFAESMEQTFNNTDIFGEPLLSQLTLQQGTSIYGNTELSETSWTFASMTAALCGLPYKVYVPLRNLSDNVVCISDILQKNNYNLYFLQGSSLKFSGSDEFLKKHGFAKLDDISTLQSIPTENTYDIKFIGRIAEDSAILNIFKEHIIELSAQKTPFMAVAFTTNTHPYNGHTEQTCRQKYNDMRDGIICSDTYLAEFVQWFKSQEFSADTTLIILGDHLMQYNSVQKYLDRAPKRETLNMMWGYAAPKQSFERRFNQFDLAPTLLEMAGFEWKEHKFALGTSLLSAEKTLQEAYGDTLNKRLIKNSRLYENLLSE